jgi:hypothetical protein
MWPPIGATSGTVGLAITAFMCIPLPCSVGEKSRQPDWNTNAVELLMYESVKVNRDKWVACTSETVPLLSSNLQRTNSTYDCPAAVLQSMLNTAPVQGHESSSISWVFCMAMDPCAQRTVMRPVVGKRALFNAYRALQKDTAVVIPASALSNERVMAAGTQTQIHGDAEISPKTALPTNRQ